MKLSILIPYTEHHLGLAKRLRIRTIELRLGPEFPISLRESGIDEAKRAADDLAARGIEVAALGFYRNMLSPDVEEREMDLARLRQVMRLAPVFGAKVIGVFAGRLPDLGIEDNIPEFKRVWSPIAAEAEQHELKIAFENCTMFRGYPIRGINIAHTPHAYDLMFEAVPSSALGIEFDPSHLVKQRIDPVGFIRCYGERILHVHAKDHEWLPELLERHGCLSLRASRDRHVGKGQVDWADCITALRESGYEGALSIEGEHDPECHTPEEEEKGLADAVALLRSLL